MNNQNPLLSFNLSIFALGISLFVFGLSISVATAQNALPQIEADSLWAVWTVSSRPDTAKLKALHDYARGFMSNQPDSAFYFAQLGLDYATKKGLKEYIANSIMVCGESFLNRGDYTEALDYFQRALGIREEIGSDKNVVASTLNAIGSTYVYLGDYAHALEFYERGLEQCVKSIFREALTSW